VSMKNAPLLEGGEKLRNTP